MDNLVSRGRGSPVLSVASWNVAGFRPMRSLNHFDYAEERPSLFVDELRRVDADVVVFQESHSSPEVSLATMVAGDLGMEWVLDRDMSPSHIDPKYRLATAVLSKWRFTETAVYRLPDPHFPLRVGGKGDPVQPHARFVLIVKVEGVTIATTHTIPLEYLGHPGGYTDGPGAGLAQAITRLLLSVLPSDGPLVLAGDFNTDDFAAAFPELVSGLGLREALTVPATVPWGGHPDHIMYSGMEPLYAEVTATTGPSDHYLGRATLKRL